MPATEKISRTTIGLPVERFAQLRALASARDLAPAALVEEWITKAVADGAPGATSLPGYSAWRDDNVVTVEIAGRSLPMMTTKDALRLSILLDAAAPVGGRPGRHVNMKGDFTLSPGKALPLPIGPVTLIVGRKGRGVVFVIRNNETGQTDQFSAPTSYVAELADEIREAVDKP